MVIFQPPYDYRGQKTLHFRIAPQKKAYNIRKMMIPINYK